MIVRVEGFGDNYAIFFTQEQAAELGFYEGMELELTKVDDKIILTPVAKNSTPLDK